MPLTDNSYGALPDLGDVLADPVAELLRLEAEIGDGPDSADRREMARELREALVEMGW